VALGAGLFDAPTQQVQAPNQIVTSEKLPVILG
jgi:hypothetical protein